MGGLFLILPVVAFDLWLGCTTGRRQLAAWAAQKKWPNLAGTAAAGLALAVWLGFFVQFSAGPNLRVRGFPIPVAFFHLDDKIWTAAPLTALDAAADILTGLAAPFIPLKIAQFLKTVKTELK